MAKYGGSSLSLFLVDAYNLVSSLTDTVSFQRESITEQTNPFGSSSEKHTPIGLEKGMLETGNNFFDTATDALHNVVGATRNVSRQISIAFEGNEIGKGFVGMEGAYDHIYTVKDRRDGLTNADVKYLITGLIEEGVIVQHLLQFAADWDTKTGGSGATDAPVDYTLDPRQTPIPITSASKANPSVVTTTVPHNLTTGQIILISGNTLSGPAINGEQTVTVISSTTFSVDGVDTSLSSGAGTGGSFLLCSTENGGVGYFHCTEYTGFDSFVNSIMHSPDDSTYASLIAFASITDEGKERKTVSGTIDRYLSNNGNVTGTGTVTAFAGLCRY